MKYKKILPGVFHSRPNRFIAHIEIDGQVQVCHVKNTGRCKELLLPGATVYVEESDNPKRKTKFDLIAVKKGERIINMDSQAPNMAVGEWLRIGNNTIVPSGVKATIRPEYTYEASRFDFYVEYERESGELEKIFVEVKGVTLEQDGVVSFPDAPSERAIKHVKELIKAKEQGYQCYVLFIIQMKGVKYFCPSQIHPEFCEVLRKAHNAGVGILAYDCKVTPDSMELEDEVEVRFV